MTPRATIAALGALMFAFTSWGAVAHADESLTPPEHESLAEDDVADPKGPTRVRSAGAVAAGVILITAGVGGGAALLGVASNSPGSGQGLSGLDNLDHTLGFGMAGLLTLGVGLGVGIPVLVIGARQQPVRGEGVARALPSELSLEPTSVTVGPGSMSAGWVF